MITSAVAILFAVGYLLATVWLCRGIRLTARDLCLGGIVCAMTLVLATIRIPLPTGSNITCGSWIPLMLLALLYDYRLSMLSGWVCGILAMARRISVSGSTDTIKMLKIPSGSREDRLKARL